MFSVQTVRARSCFLHVVDDFKCETSGLLELSFCGALNAVLAQFVFTTSSHAATWGFIRRTTAMSCCCRITTWHAHVDDYVHTHTTCNSYLDSALKTFQMNGRCM